MSSCSGAAALPGTITGQVVDPVPMPLPRVKVAIIFEGFSGRRYSSLTDKDGYFRVEGIAPGVYTVDAKLQGFRKRVLHHVKVGDGELKDLGPVKMELAPCGSRNGGICDEVH